MLQPRPPACYGLDIETDTAAGGLDPRRAGILAVALSGPGGDTVFTGPEAALLSALDDALSGLTTGIIVTWNGSGFDLPFIAERAAVAGIDLGLRLVLDPTIERSRPPLPGHSGAYRAAWHQHRHLDAYSAYRSFADNRHLSNGLKAVARRAGFPAVEVDASLVHRLSSSALQRYVASDASLARRLAMWRWTEMEGHIDPPPRQWSIDPRAPSYE
ncbi:MAG: 3'-5' exonuclease [Acidimicrobiales bacterium]